MTADPVTLALDDDLDVAETAMAIARIHHLPVVKGEEVVGVISDRDLLRVSLSALVDVDEEENHRLLSAVPARLVMSTDLMEVAPDMDAAEAGSLLTQRRGGCLLVVEAGQLVGIVTE